MEKPHWRRGAPRLRGFFRAVGGTDDRGTPSTARIALCFDANIAATGHSRRCRRDELSHLTRAKSSPASPPIASASFVAEAMGGDAGAAFRPGQVRQLISAASSRVTCRRNIGVTAECYSCC